MLSWLMLAELFPGGGFGVGEAFGIRALLSEMEEFFHGLGQIGS